MPSELAPGFLIAAPNMDDPNFSKSVILMAEHNDDGAIGFIVNKPTPLTLGVLLFGVDEDLADMAAQNGLGGLPVLLGGPVQRHIAWVLYKRQEDEILDEGSISVGDVLTLGASMDTLRAFISRQRTGPFQVILGYSGWGEQQLEGEITRGSWLPLDLENTLAFDTPVESCWDEAVKLLGLTPGGFMMGGPGALA